MQFPRLDVHQESGADVGVPGHAAHIGVAKLAGEQGGRAEHVPQAVPGPPSVAVRVAPADREVGALEDVAVEVGGPPVLARRRGENQPQRVGSGFVLGSGLLNAGGKLLGERVAVGVAARVDRLAVLPALGGASTYRCPATSITLRSTVMTRLAWSIWPMVSAVSSPHRSP